MRKFIFLAISLVALAIPTLALAGTTTVGGCTFTTNDKTKTMSLVADCNTDTTIGVANGWTLDGAGKTITVVDGPSGSFNGAVVQNDGTTMNVKNLKIDGGATIAPENCNRVFNGVAFMAASGSITGVELTNIGRPADTGCQLGRAILVDNLAGIIRQSVRIEGNTVSDYNKNGIDVRGSVDAKIIGNTVKATPSAIVARNGIVVRTNVFFERGATADTDTATAQVWNNTVSGNHYAPEGTESAGILVMGNATVNMTKQNSVFHNEVNFLNEGGTVAGKFKTIA